MANPQGAFIWYELMSADPAASKAFYDAVVGWTIDDQTALPGGVDYRMIKRSDGGNAGGVLALNDDMRANGARPMWIGYLYVEDVDGAIAQIGADGGSLLMPAWDAQGVGRIAMVTDPQGVSFYIMKPTPPAGQEDATSDVFSVDQAQHVRWNELSTTDLDGAMAFYRRHFGWDQQGEMDMGEYGPYRFIQHDGVGIGAVMRKPPQMPQPAWTYYIGVDDIDRAAGAVTQGGGRILSGPMEIPGGEFSLNGLDPSGASFGLVGPRKH